MPGRKAVLRLVPWNSLRPVGFSRLYSLCGTNKRYQAEPGSEGLPGVQQRRRTASRCYWEPFKQQMGTYAQVAGEFLTG
jgi:hypothetical protein